MYKRQGVAFTLDPATGENKLMGEFLINAQGEDVVAGVRTPMPIAQMEQEFPEAVSYTHLETECLSALPEITRHMAMQSLRWKKL